MAYMYVFNLTSLQRHEAVATLKYLKEKFATFKNIL